MANAQYFHSLMPKFSYKTYVIFFVTITFAIANFGLTNIITYSVPILMFLYPLAIVLILLTFLSPLFKHAQLVYITTISVTFVIGFFDGLKSLAECIRNRLLRLDATVITLFEKWLPLYGQGLGWLVPAAISIVITDLISRFQMSKVSTSRQTT